MAEKTVKPLRVTDKLAIQLVHEKAPKQHRSLANCAAAAIIESLSGRRDFRDNIITRGTGQGGTGE